jgi:hypothetical protein
MTIVSKEALDNSFDTRQVGKMTALKTVQYCKQQWMDIQGILSNAHQNGNLRDTVRDTFFRLCTYPELVDNFRVATGCVVAKKSSNVVNLNEARGKPAVEKARKAGRSEKDRQARSDDTNAHRGKKKSKTA